ncbi:MAG TPA: ABC transporter permease [Burkholderiales bacterium]|nr:ABC transporter permease [Burkholderiales bacterium]
MTGLRNGEPARLALLSANGVQRIALTGSWNRIGLSGHARELGRELERHGGDDRLHWDLSEIAAMDSAGAALIWRALGGRDVSALEVKPEHRALLAALNHVPQLPAARRKRILPVEAIGRSALSLRAHWLEAIRLLGQLTLDTFALARRPGSVPWREISANIYKTGARALGITALVGFLIGVVLAYLLARQLRYYGADVFLVNLLGISIVRELGPLLAAILVAGRSGSSMTAQLGAMRLTQELDALAVMDISHTQRLVLSKIVALALALPLVVLWTSGIALLGGMVAASAQLDFSYRNFLLSLPSAVPIANLWLGLGKGAVFGALIAFVACHFGLRIRPNTESLGEGTTNSVVTAITVVIFVDAVFAVVFANFGFY